MCASADFLHRRRTGRLTRLLAPLQRIVAGSSEDLLIYVPSLDEVVKQRCGKNLFFSTDVQGAIKENCISAGYVGGPTCATIV